MKLDLKHAEELCAGGGDWERKNRLRVYEAVFLLATRDLARAANLLLDSIATFNSCACPALRCIAVRRDGSGQRAAIWRA